MTAPQLTLPEPEELVLPVIAEKKETEMPEAESVPEATTEELPTPTPEIEKQPEVEQDSAPPAKPAPTQASPAQTAPEAALEPEPETSDSSSADVVYVPGFGWIQSEGPNHVEYAEDMYENGNKIGIMG